MNKSRDRNITNANANTNSYSNNYNINTNSNNFYTDNYNRSKSRDVSASKLTGNANANMASSTSGSNNIRRTPTAVNHKGNYSSNNYLQSTTQNYQKERVMNNINTGTPIGKGLINSQSTQNISSKNIINKNIKINPNQNISNNQFSSSNYPEHLQEDYLDHNLETESYLKYSQTCKKDKISPSGKFNLTNDKEKRPKSNNNSNLMSSHTSTKGDNIKNYNEYNYSDKLPLSKENDSVYTNYKKVKRSGNNENKNSNVASSNNFSNQSQGYSQGQGEGKNNNHNNLNINNNYSKSNFLFDSTFGRMSETSEKLKLMNMKKIPQNNSQILHTDTSLPVRYVNSNNNRDLNNFNNFTNENLKKQPSKDKIYLEKKDSFSLYNYASETNILSNLNLNKETSESIKFKLTNTHSSGGQTAMHSLEEVKSLFNKLDPEEYHLVSVNLITSSKRVVRMHEHVPERENLFSTVTNYEERDL